MIQSFNLEMKTGIPSTGIPSNECKPPLWVSVNKIIKGAINARLKFGLFIADLCISNFSILYYF